MFFGVAMLLLPSYKKSVPVSQRSGLTWVKWLRMQGHRLPATLEVTGSNPGPGKINLIEK
jgi:hypothetical protein